ncbi:hypothetical protein SLEP1_g29810 [Rubroshorea leprosula]|uniref:Uncharacterized protein n=1 Tax=Rubroshorea leprosula TaxID=152421 RepID=A0AAV5K9A5_9ROSI|nr:hypothetical protein SLEP1_g29810 [Rubroshorea leprosula]
MVTLCTATYFKKLEGQLGCMSAYRHMMTSSCIHHIMIHVEKLKTMARSNLFPLFHISKGREFTNFGLKKFSSV